MDQKKHIIEWQPWQPGDPKGRKKKIGTFAKGFGTIDTSLVMAYCFTMTSKERQGVLKDEPDRLTELVGGLDESSEGKAIIGSSQDVFLTLGL